MASGVIPNSAITISSCQASRDCGPAGRLDTPYPWVPDESDYANPWIQVSLHSFYIITGVSTDGHNLMDHWVSSYTLSYSLDNNAWLPYRDVYTTSDSNISKVDTISFNYIRIRFFSDYVAGAVLEQNFGEGCWCLEDCKCGK